MIRSIFALLITEKKENHSGIANIYQTSPVSLNGAKNSLSGECPIVGNPWKIAVVHYRKYPLGIHHFPALCFTEGSKGKRQGSCPPGHSHSREQETSIHTSSQHKAMASTTEGSACGDGKHDRDPHSHLRPVVMGCQDSQRRLSEARDIAKVCTQEAG